MQIHHVEQLAQKEKCIQLLADEEALSFRHEEVKI